MTSGADGTARRIGGKAQTFDENRGVANKMGLSGKPLKSLQGGEHQSLAVALKNGQAGPGRNGNRQGKHGKVRWRPGHGRELAANSLSGQGLMRSSD